MEDSTINTFTLFTKPAQERLAKKTQQILSKLRSRRPEEVKLC